MNTLPNVYKLLYFNLTMSSLYHVKLKITQNSRLLTAVRYVEPIATMSGRCVIGQVNMYGLGYN